MITPLTIHGIASIAHRRSSCTTLTHEAYLSGQDGSGMTAMLAIVLPTEASIRAPTPELLPLLRS